MTYFIAYTSRYNIAYRFLLALYTVHVNKQLNITSNRCNTLRVDGYECDATKALKNRGPKTDA